MTTAGLGAMYPNTVVLPQLDPIHPDLLALTAPEDYVKVLQDAAELGAHSLLLVCCVPLLWVRMFVCRVCACPGASILVERVFPA